MYLSSAWNVSTRTLRRRLQHPGLFAWRPLLRLSLALQHRDDTSNDNTGCKPRPLVVFSDDSRFCMQHRDGLIRVWSNQWERMWNACIQYRHRGPALCLRVWATITRHIGYTTRTILVRVDNLNSKRYISHLLKPVAVSYIWCLVCYLFQEDNTRPHVVCYTLNYLDKEGWSTVAIANPFFKFIFHWKHLIIG